MPDNHPGVAGSLIVLGKNLVQQEKFDEAEPLLRECLAIRQKALPPDHWRIYSAMSILGECLTGLGQWAEAEPLLLDGYQGLHENSDAIPGQYRDVRLREALERIVNLYEARHAAEPDAGHDAAVAEWRARLEAASSQPTTQPSE